MRRLGIGLSTGITILLGVCVFTGAQANDTLFNMGAMGFWTPYFPDTQDYLPDMHAMGGNWMMMTQAYFRNEPEMRARFEEADDHGIRIVLTNARLWTDPPDMNVTRIAA